MFRIRPVIICVLNILLITLSWVFYKFPQGDEYLVLYMIPIIFIVAPFMITISLVGALVLVNFAFFIVYGLLGALNAVDILVLMALLVSVAGASLLVKYLFNSFVSYHESDIKGRQRRYNSIVNDLEAIDRRGRRIEGELSRISRLYEVTKSLAPSLTFEELLSALFDFLGENFKFDAVHLLAFSKDKLARGISKSVGEENYYEDSENVLDYEKLAEYVEEKDPNPFFLEKDDDAELFDDLKVRSESLMVFPLHMGDKPCAILAIEGASRPSYGRFRLLVPQIAMEFRKVELYEEVQELSIVDGLTEVYLRRYLMNRLEEEVERANRLGLTFSLCMIDVDHFKDCNDRHGHLVGDAVLRKIAETLKLSVREVDMIARYGGEEFCIVFPETTKDLALTIAERLRKAIGSKKIKVFDEKVRMTVSLGVSTFPDDGTDVAALIERADTALYRAKRGGRNMVCGA